MSKRADEAVRKLVLEEESIEEVLGVYETPDFVEVQGKIGGDLITRRIYDKPDEMVEENIQKVSGELKQPVRRKPGGMKR